MQSEGSFPEEHRGRRPPPSTSSPCPAWFFRLRSPFFRGSKTPVQKRFAPLQLLALVQLAQKRPPDVQPNAPLLPVSQPPPAGRGMREFLRHVLPASPAPQNPQNPFQHMTVLNPGTTALAWFGRLGEQGRDLLPLRLGQQHTRSGHRPSLGAADSAYLSSQKIQLPSFQNAVSGYATASREFGLVIAPDLATKFHWQCQRPLQVLHAMFDGLDKSYNGQSVAHKPPLNFPAVSKKR